MRVTGADLLTHVLDDAGVRYLSGIPGHTVFKFANTAGGPDGLQPLLVRNEAIASFAADVYHRLSGNLMAVFAHTLPGTLNLAPGVGNAYADSSAMLVIVGETAREASGRGAYQELARGTDNDVPQMLRHIVKRSWQAHEPLQLVEQALRAIKLARLGRPGPVALHVFQEVWEQEVEIPGWPSTEGYLIGNAFRPAAGDVERAADHLRRAERPLIVAGNGVNLARATDELVALAEALDVPVATTVTGKGAFPEDHRLSLGVIGWVGSSSANWAGRNADVTLALGARLTETTTSSWQPGATFAFDRGVLIHADVDPTGLANVYPVDVPLIGDLKLTLQDLGEACDPPSDLSEWQRGLAAAKEEWSTVVERARRAGDEGDGLPVGPLVADLRAATEGNPVSIVCDVGKHHKWVVQQFEARRGDAVVSSMGAGTMGIGACGAVGAALARPDVPAIAWTGDGGLSMVPYVLPTIAEHQLPITLVVIDDGAFGEVVNVQEERFPHTVFGRFDGSGRNPGYRLDMCRLAESCGIPAQRIDRLEDFRPALADAVRRGEPCLVDVTADRRSRVPSGGGSKLRDIWNHPVHPWSRSADARRPEPETARA